MVLTRSGVKKLNQTQGQSPAGTKQKATESEVPVGSTVQKRGAASKRAPAPKKDVKDFQAARQSVAEAINLLAEKSNDKEESDTVKNTKVAQPATSTAQPDLSTVSNKQPTKKAVKKKATKKAKAKNTSPLKNSDKENEPVPRVRTSYLARSDDPPPREPSVKIMKVSSNINQQPLKTQADGKRKK
ncbi:hypothetical protein KR084_004761 [Drosophila pseudotakahashii]|nr:hypothetical protein KR084_004761 [Drosophila pseudotakahashii]